MRFRLIDLFVAGVVPIFCLSGQASASESASDKAIAEHRMGTITIATKPGAEVRVRQLQHEFWFGAALSSHVFSDRADPELAAKYKQVFLENFNSAVTENALKWHAMERQRGNVDYSIVDAILQWTEQNEIPLRGHNIYWGVSNRVQPWQKQLTMLNCVRCCKTALATLRNDIVAGLPSTI